MFLMSSFNNRGPSKTFPKRLGGYPAETLYYYVLFHVIASYLQLYRWFTYDVIKNMIMQIKINLPQILICLIRPYNVSLYLI